MQEAIWLKLQEKFSSMSACFRFFDLNCDNKVNKQEFFTGIESLGVRLSYSSAMKVFEGLDKDLDGQLSYQEFCQLSEEKRRGIDPFDSHFAARKQTHNN
mmetsp:Transcript_20919/g.15363  ORF Transcript_20919/g.15363 Transcript_20919/m.15363 type:complete len:100 (-) Transcript_20919:3-302(-)